MSKKYNIKSCHLEFTLSMIAGKWKIVILWYLGRYGIHRYGEIKKVVTGITVKMLTQQLKELEANGLIIRTQYNSIPPKVEYQLSKKGFTLMPLIEMMYEWGELNNNGATDRI